MNNTIDNLRLTPQERYLYQHHLRNLVPGARVDNPNGSTSTVRQMTVEIGGRTYNIPTVWDGQILSPPEAMTRARAVGVQNFPSYPTQAAAEARYAQMHRYMTQDVQNRQSRKFGRLFTPPEPGLPGEQP